MTRRETTGHHAGRQDALTASTRLRAGAMSAVGLAARAVAAAILLCAVNGCASLKTQEADADTSAVQSVLMSLSDDLTFSVADACAQVIVRTNRPEARVFCTTMRLKTAVGSITAATCPNPYVGHADLLTLATLQRMALEEPHAHEALGDEEDRLLLYRTVADIEERLWAQTQFALTQWEKDELRAMIVDWRNEHPERVNVTHLQLADFDRERQVSLTDGTTSGRLSILRLLRIDPMKGLDPATRQLRQSTLLGERMAFWGQRLPLILGWQAEMTTAQLLSTGTPRQLADNAEHVMSSVDQFSRSAERMATSFERTLDEFPKERAAIIAQLDHTISTQLQSSIAQLDHTISIQLKSTIAQLDQAISTQLTSSIEQATAAIESERKVTIQQAGEEAAKRLAELVDRVNDHTAAQRSGLLGDAEAASRRLLNRMATLTILVITAGAIVVACVVLAYRRVTARLGK